MLSIPIPTGYTGVAPQVTSTATSFSTSDNAWETYQPIATGATSLSVITFITSGVVQLPANAAVSRSVPVIDGTMLGVWKSGHSPQIAFQACEGSGYSSTAEHDCRTGDDCGFGLLQRRMSALSTHTVQLDERATCVPQIQSVSVAATFTVLSGQVSSLGWMFREDVYTAVRALDPATLTPAPLTVLNLHGLATDHSPAPCCVELPQLEG